MSNTTTLPQIDSTLSLRIDSEVALQLADLQAAEIDLTCYDDTMRRRVKFNALSLAPSFQDTAALIKFYESRYGIKSQPTTITAREAEQQILTAGVPYIYVRGMLKRQAVLTREYVAEQIAAYFALKAITEQKNAAKLAEIMQLHNDKVVA